MLEQSKKISSYTDFWRHHCLQTLFLLFKFAAIETIENQPTNALLVAHLYQWVTSAWVSLWKSLFSQRKLQGTPQIAGRINNHDDDDSNGKLNKTTTLHVHQNFWSISLPSLRNLACEHWLYDKKFHKLVLTEYFNAPRQFLFLFMILNAPLSIQRYEKSTAITKPVAIILIR